MFKQSQPKPSPALEEARSSTDLVSRRAKLEDERMSRRQALRKMGILSGMAVLSLLTVDDLARMAAKQLSANAGDSEVAGEVAKSLRGAGVAYADPNNPVVDKYGGVSITDCEERCLDHAALFQISDGTARAILTGPGGNGVIDYCRSHYPNYSGGNWSPYLNCVVDGLNRATGGKYQVGVHNYLVCCYAICASGYDNYNDPSCTPALVYNPSGRYVQPQVAGNGLIV